MAETETTEDAGPVTADEVYEALSVRFSAPQFALLPQATDGTGARIRRRLDAVAMSLWPSRGIWLHGFEIKVSRYDWLREVRQPEKAEALFEHLDYFSVVVADAEIVEEGELPPTWGLIVLGADRSTLRTKVEAPALHPGPRSALDRDFVAAILRRFEETRISKALTAHGKKEFDRGYEYGQNAAKRGLTVDQERALHVKAFVDAAECHWNDEADAARVGRIYKVIRDMHRYDGMDALIGGVEKVRASAHDLRKMLGED